MILGGQFGCASSSPFNQTFVEVRSPHFHVISSFGDRSTRALVRDLEVFHAAVISSLGMSLDVKSMRPTQVIAFDGRSMSRPFSERGAAASLVPTIDGPILMIRAIGDFRERVDSDLRHRYAHRILRDLSGLKLPLWYEEGHAQLAATIEQSGDVALVGRSHAEHRRLLLDWRHQDLTTAMVRRHLATASASARTRFEASTWAIVHTLLFDSTQKREGRAALDAVLSASVLGEPGRLEKAVEALGSGPVLTERIYTHLERDRHRVDRLQLGGLSLANLELEPVPPVVARDRMGELALALERPGLAQQYFEHALRDRPDYPPSLAGLALADAVAGRLDRIEARVSRVVGSADSDAVAASRLGRALSLTAAKLPVGQKRTEYLLSARRFFERSLVLQPGRLEAQMGLGLCYLVSGTELIRARDWFETALRQSPGSLELELWLARVQMELGRPNSALSGAQNVLSRSHSTLLRDSAREMIEQIDRLGAP